ncbi:hypothetical protein B296_00017447 [Ensete ventricosum]|uniref:Uncharacterized protein n=1 Tax=Ensete ventricosum TaxID=4639 RepID=A0A427AGM2_ENSVE|nr:hypothetical protein B296_00017447 [Ensete ventricosum]
MSIFIPVRGELVSTPSFTFVVPRDMTETYGGCATTAAWGKSMLRHATLMGVGLDSVVPDHLHLGYQIDYRPDPSAASIVVSQNLQKVIGAKHINVSRSTHFTDAIK